MKVICHYRTDTERGLTDPLPEKKYSFVFRLYSGDVCDPSPFHWLKGENWFKPPFPSTVYRYFVSWPILPFVAWRFENKGGYLGFKLYGVDAPAYKDWTTGIKPDDVYDGSQALCLTFRPFATLID